MAKVRVEKLDSTDDFKKYIKFDGNCISQVISFIPSSLILAQVCEIFFHYVSTSKKLRIKSPSLFFLSILYNNTNIKEILDQINLSPNKYVIHCCDNENYPKVNITNNEIRLELSQNAINSLDSLL